MEMLHKYINLILIYKETLIYADLILLIINLRFFLERIYLFLEKFFIRNYLYHVIKNIIDIAFQRLLIYK